MRLSLKELRERREHGPTEVENRRLSGIPLEVILSANGAITELVSLAEALTGFGLSLEAAHAALNRIVAGDAVSVILQLTPGGDMPFALCRFGLSLGQPVDAEPSMSVEGLLGRGAASRDVVSSFEHWRLSQPTQPPAREALGLMVRSYLAEHGLLTVRKKRKEAEV